MFFQLKGVISLSNTILLSSSGTYHTSSLPSISFMLSHFSGTVYLSQDNTTPNPSHSSAAIFITQSDVKLSASNSSVTSSLRQSILNYSMVTPSQPFSTLPQYSSGDNVTDVSLTSSNSVIALQANKSLDVLDTRPLGRHGASFTLSSSQLDAGLSSSHYYVTLWSSHLNVPSSHGAIVTSSRYDGSASKTNYRVTHSTGPSHSVVKLSPEKSQVMQSVTLTTLQRTHHNTGYSTLETMKLSSLPYFYTPSIFALNKSIVTNINSGTFIPATEKNSQDGIASLVHESTLIKPSLSADRDTPLSVNPNPNTMDTSHASPVDSSINGNSSDKSSSGSSLMNYSVENSSAHHRYMQMVQLSKPENITHIQTRLTSIISNANKSSLSIHKLSLLKNNLDATLTKKCNHSSFPSSNIIYHFISDVNILTDSSSDFLRDIYTNRLALSSVQSLDRTTFPTRGFKATIAKLSSFSKASGKRSYCCFIAYDKL